ncbi:MAG TPA: hypothetical protein VGQ38_21580 [Gaiellaceae bacterium]|jgi:hypothetical protein|nr:hypothetical protein [Gaiellaceae bacterium]
MTETIDNLIRARFDRVANPLDDGDWNDVLGRANASGRRGVPTRIALAAAVVLLAAIVTAAAFGWPRTLVDFSTAPPAPERVKAFFGGHDVAVPDGVSPWTKLGQAREIMTASFDAEHLDFDHPTMHRLYVAPREDGGFCYLWTDLGGSCADTENAAKATTNPAARPLGLESLENDYVGFVTGWVRAGVQTLEARFADGTSVAIPVTWVSAPISAGFFAYVVTGKHLTRADALTSVVALDGTGNTVDKQPFGVTKPLDEDVMQTLPDETRLSLPRRAQASRAHELATFHAANGGHAYLWVMPRTGGGVCFIYGTGAGGGGGCPSPYWAASLPPVDSGGTNGVYFAQVKPEIATVELRYRNGDSERFTPTDGFVLHQMQHATGLVAVVGLDRSGNAIYTQHERWHPVVVQP